MSHTSIAIIALSVLVVVAGFLVQIFDANENKLGVKISVWISMILGIALAIFCWISSYDDSNQKDRIEALAQKSDSLSTQIVSLTLKIDTIVSYDTFLVRQNIGLTDSSAQLTKTVKELTIRANRVMNKMNLKSDQEYAVSGDFNLSFSKPITPESEVTLEVGSNTIVNNVKAYKKDVNLRRFCGNINNIDPNFFFRISDSILLIRTKIFDLNQNLIAEVDHNKWRINKNFVSKFNFDNRGFEVFDNQGRIALNVDVLADNKIAVQGIFVDNSHDGALVATSEGAEYVGGIKSSNAAVDINEYLKDHPIRQLFEYTGSKWHGVRRN